MLLSLLTHLSPSTSFCTIIQSSVTTARRRATVVTVRPLAAKAGSFFNPVPDDGGGDPKDDETKKNKKKKPQTPLEDFNDDVADLLRRRKKPSLASQPSTINGVPTKKATGFGKMSSSSSSSSSSSDKPFVAIGKPLNDISKPEYDDQGYTLYADETTGEKSRVFEALVDYPCDFTMKIIGRDEGAFVEEMVDIVAESCEVKSEAIKHTVRLNGKWTSLTVQAPVQSAEMLYALYENVDRDPRVKFKF